MVSIDKSYLVTGGAGALGRELVARLLRRDPGARVTLLLRARSRVEAQARLEEIRRYLTHLCGAEDTARLRAQGGDITRPRLGLSSDAYAKLTGSVTHVIHSAASIRLDQPIADARRVNVEGTREVLRFARGCPRLVVLSHISTAYVAGDRQGLIREDELEEGQGFTNAYERSKWEAECVLRAAIPAMPILIFRPSIVVGDSVDGHLSCLSTIYTPLRAIVQQRVRTIPGCSTTRLDLVPVDYAARAIAELSSEPRRHGETYHVTGGWARAVRVDQLVQSALRFFVDPRGRGPRFSPRANGTNKLGVFFDYLSGRKDFDDTNLRRDLGADRRGVPPVLDLLPNLFTYCRISHWGAVRPWESPFTREESCARQA